MANQPSWDSGLHMSSHPWRPAHSAAQSNKEASHQPRCLQYHDVHKRVIASARFLTDGSCPATAPVQSIVECSMFMSNRQEAATLCAVNATPGIFSRVLQVFHTCRHKKHVLHVKHRGVISNPHAKRTRPLSRCNIPNRCYELFVS